jgi:hypothetical protein
VRSGPFALDDAWTIRELESLDLQSEWPAVAVHPDGGSWTLDAILLDENATTDWGFGRDVPDDRAAAEYVRVYDRDGEWLGIARGDVESGAWRPYKVVSAAA